MLIDSHAHFPENIEITKLILERAKNNDVEKVVSIGTDLEENRSVINQINTFDNLYGAIGIYPQSHRGENLTNLMKKLEVQLQESNKIVAIGEIGLDITNWEKQRNINEQIELFEMQIKIAYKNKLPIVIHNRNGDELVINILKKNQNINGVIHCFSQNWEFAKKVLDLGMYISFSGFITHNSKNYLLETVKKVPNSKFLVETDSPYIVPKGIKDKKNEPKNVRMIAQKIAQVKEVTLEEVEELSYQNTCRLFSL